MTFIEFNTGLTYLKKNKSSSMFYSFSIHIKLFKKPNECSIELSSHHIKKFISLNTFLVILLIFYAKEITNQATDTTQSGFKFLILFV